jgi:imidazolonepropionase-like amidohydrolase
MIHARWLDADPQKGVAYDHDTAKRAAAKGMWVDPTIGHHLLGVEARQGNNAPPPLRHWSVQAKPVSDAEHFETVSRMHEAGIRFTAGLDMGMPYADHAKSAANAWAYVEELEWDNWKAIRANTADTAEALRLGDEVGRIKTGMVADMAAFKGDPGSRIRDLDQADSVVQGGRVVKLRGAALV